jgi:hypothetical protein
LSISGAASASASFVLFNVAAESVTTVVVDGFDDGDDGDDDFAAANARSTWPRSRAGSTIFRTRDLSCFTSVFGLQTSVNKPALVGICYEDEKQLKISV